MATEKRLIDAISLIGKSRRMETTDNNGIPVDTFAVPVLVIEDAPTVDAVEVVRCKDCKKWHRHTEVDRERGECRRYQTTKHETGFCDRGERRTNDT